MWIGENSYGQCSPGVKSKSAKLLDVFVVVCGCCLLLVACCSLRYSYEYRYVSVRVFGGCDDGGTAKNLVLSSTLKPGILNISRRMRRHSIFTFHGALTPTFTALPKPGVGGAHIHPSEVVGLTTLSDTYK